MLADLHDGSSIHRQYNNPTYFSSVILFVSVYPLPLVIRYRHMPLATPAPVMLFPVHPALLTIFRTFGI